MYAICQRNREEAEADRRRLQASPSATRTTRTCSPIPNVDFVHINTPIPDHAPQSIAALKAGKHVMCTVPMATTVEECQQIVELVEEDRPQVHDGRDGRLRPRVLCSSRSCTTKGELGKIQFLQASHQQDMDGWPNYWPGLPPMHYATHCVGPCLALTRAEAEYVSCFGSGTHPQGADRASTTRPSPSRRATSSSADSDSDGPHLPLAVRHGPAIPRELRRLRHEEVLRVAADRRGGAGAAHGEEAGAGDSRSASRCPTTPICCPRRSSASRRKGVYDCRATRTCRSCRAAGHGGSHPHLVHEFVSALVGRPRSVSQRGAVGQLDLRRHLAHESALKGGEVIQLPAFTLM